MSKGNAGIGVWESSCYAVVSYGTSHGITVHLGEMLDSLRKLDINSEMSEIMCCVKWLEALVQLKQIKFGTEGKFGYTSI